MKLSIVSFYAVVKYHKQCICYEIITFLHIKVLTE